MYKRLATLMDFPKEILGTITSHLGDHGIARLAQAGRASYEMAQETCILSQYLTRFTFNGHKGAVLSVATYAQDGQIRIVSGSVDETAQIWNDRGKKLATLANFDWVCCIAASNQDQKIRIATGSPVVNQVRIWDSEGKCLATLYDRVNSISIYEQDNKTLTLTGSQDNKARIWNDKAECIATLVEHSSDILSVATYKKDNKIQIITGSWDKTVRIWNDQGTCLATLVGHSDGVRSVATYEQNGQTLIVSGSHDNTARIWNNKGVCLNTLVGHSSCVHSIATYKKDGQTQIVTGSWDKTVRIWNDQGTCLATLEGHSDGVNSVATYAQDGQIQIVSGSWDNTARIWNPRKFKVKIGSKETIIRKLWKNIKRLIQETLNGVGSFLFRNINLRLNV